MFDPHSTLKRDDNASSKDSLKEQSSGFPLLHDDGSQRFTQVSHNDVLDYGLARAFLLSLLRSLSGAGYVYASDEYLCWRLQCSERSLRNALAYFENKKILFRNTWPTKFGRKRHLILADKAEQYREKFLNRACVPQNVFDRFTDFFALRPLQKQPAEPTANHDKKPAADPPTADFAAACNPTAKVAAAYSTNTFKKKAPYNDSGRAREDAVVVGCFEEAIEREFAKAGIGSLAEQAREAYRANERMIKAKDNPTGFLIWAAKSGKIAEMLPDTEAEDALDAAHSRYRSRFETMGDPYIVDVVGYLEREKGGFVLKKRVSDQIGKRFKIKTVDEFRKLQEELYGKSLA